MKDTGTSEWRHEYPDAVWFPALQTSVRWFSSPLELDTCGLRSSNSDVRSDATVVREQGAGQATHKQPEVKCDLARQRPQYPSGTALNTKRYCTVPTLP